MTGTRLPRRVYNRVFIGRGASVVWAGITFGSGVMAQTTGPTAVPSSSAPTVAAPNLALTNDVALSPPVAAPPEGVPPEGVPPEGVHVHAPALARPSSAAPGPATSPERPMSAASPTPAAPAPAAPAPAPVPAAPAPASRSVPPPPALDSDWGWVETVTSGPPRVNELDASDRKLPFRGSGLTWGHTATTSLMGIGADYISSSYQVYEQSYTLLLNYFVYDGPRVDIRLTTVPGVDVELTDSDITTTYREPLFRDLPVSAILSAKLAEDKSRLLHTSLSGNLTLIAPTSKMSYRSGHYLTISPRVGLAQRLPLLGRAAPVLSDIELAGQVRFDHLFSRGSVAINPELNRARRSASGVGTLSDVLDGSRIAPNAFRFELFASLTEELLGRPLTFLIGGDYTTAALYGIEPTDVRTVTGTTSVVANPASRTWRRRAGVGVEVTYHPTDPLSLAVGYANAADLDNSESANPLYTPYATFLAGVTLHLDAVFQLLSGEEVAHPPEFDPSQAGNAAGHHW